MNLEVIWLLKKLTPDFKTICDFRRINRKAFKKASREFTIFCQQLGLIAADVIAVDGTVIKASNSKSKSWTKGQLDKLLKKNEQAVEGYLQELEQLDDSAQPQVETDRKELERKLTSARNNEQKLKAVKQKMLESVLHSSTTFSDDVYRKRSLRNLERTGLKLKTVSLFTVEMR